MPPLAPTLRVHGAGMPQSDLDTHQTEPTIWDEWSRIRVATYPFHGPPIRVVRRSLDRHHAVRMRHIAWPFPIFHTTTPARPSPDPSPRPRSSRLEKVWHGPEASSAARASAAADDRTIHVQPRRQRRLSPRDTPPRISDAARGNKKVGSMNRRGGRRCEYERARWTGGSLATRRHVRARPRNNGWFVARF